MVKHLSKAEVAKQMRELAKSVKNVDIAIEMGDLAARIEEVGDRKL